MFSICAVVSCTSCAAKITEQKTYTILPSLLLQKMCRIVINWGCMCRRHANLCLISACASLEIPMGAVKYAMCGWFVQNKWHVLWPRLLKTVIPNQWPAAWLGSSLITVHRNAFVRALWIFIRLLRWCVFVYFMFFTRLLPKNRESELSVLSIEFCCSC